METPNEPSKYEVPRNRQPKTESLSDGAPLKPRTPEMQDIDRKSSPGEVAKSTASSKKIEANRRNALRSTGPKSAMGKKNVSRNAIKHGFFSKYLVLDKQESEAEFHALYEEIWQHYNPKGFVEKHRVEQIAKLLWRLRRIARYEKSLNTRAVSVHEQRLRPNSHEELDGALDEVDLLGPDYFLLPPDGDLDKILRCESMFNKQLERNLSELERLQSRRVVETTAGSKAVDFLHSK